MCSTGSAKTSTEEQDPVQSDTNVKKWRKITIWGYLKTLPEQSEQVFGLTMADRGGPCLSWSINHPNWWRRVKAWSWDYFGPAPSAEYEHTRPTIPRPFLNPGCPCLVCSMPATIHAVCCLHTSCKCANVPRLMWNNLKQTPLIHSPHWTWVKLQTSRPDSKVTATTSKIPWNYVRITCLWSSLLDGASE